MLMKIFLSRRHPAPDVPLGLIRVQHLAGLGGKGWIDLDEPVGDIFMYCTLTDSEFLCCLPYCSVMIDDIISDVHSSFLNIISQRKTPLQTLFLQCMQGMKRLFNA